MRGTELPEPIAVLRLDTDFYETTAAELEALRHTRVSLYSRIYPQRQGPSTHRALALHRAGKVRPPEPLTILYRGVAPAHLCHT